MTRRVLDLAEKAGIADPEFIAVYRRVCNAIEDEFEGSERDGGIGNGYGEHGFEVDGVIYDIRITVRGSARKAN